MPVYVELQKYVARQRAVFIVPIWQDSFAPLSSEFDKTTLCCFVGNFLLGIWSPSDGEALSYSLRDFYDDQTFKTCHVHQLSYKQNGRNRYLTRLPTKICTLQEIIRLTALPFNSK
jgi:hypothetical protein